MTTPPTGDQPTVRGTLPAMPARLARRRRMLAWSAPLLALCLIAGPFLLGLSYADNHQRDVAAGDPSEAIEGFAALADDTRYGPSRWTSVYNTGTSALMADQAGTAVTELTHALELAPAGTVDEDGEVDPELPECLVRRNLSLAYETLAEEAVTAGDLPMVEEHLLAALDALGECATEPFEEEPSESPTDQPSESPTEEPESPSEEQSDEPTEGPTEGPSEERTQDPTDEPTEGGTGDGPGPDGEDPTDGGTDDPQEDPDGTGGDPDEDGSGEPTQEPDGGGNPNDRIQQRQMDKLDQARENQDSPSDEQQSGGGDGEEQTTPMSPQEQELASRNQQSEEDRRQQEQRSGGGYGGGQNW